MHPSSIRRKAIRAGDKEAYVNNGAIAPKGLSTGAIKGHKIRGKQNQETEQAEPGHQTNLAQGVIVGIPAQIANIEYKKLLSAATLPPVLKNGKKQCGKKGYHKRARLTQHKSSQT
jgi:hypothetical protein